MTSIVDQAIERLRSLPTDVQDDLARVLLRLSGEEQAPYQLTPEEDADLAEADAEIARGELASEEEVLAVWAKHGL